jgi:hypothetical protein
VAVRWIVSAAHHASRSTAGALVPCGVTMALGSARMGMRNALRVRREAGYGGNPRRADCGRPNGILCREIAYALTVTSTHPRNDGAGWWRRRSLQLAAFRLGVP